MQYQSVLQTRKHGCKVDGVDNICVIEHSTIKQRPESPVQKREGTQAIQIQVYDGQVVPQLFEPEFTYLYLDGSSQIRYTRGPDRLIIPCMPANVKAMAVSWCSLV